MSAAYVAVKIDPKATKDVTRDIAHGRHVKQVSVIAGRYDLLVYMQAETQDNLFHAVINEIRMMPGVVSTETWVVCPS